MIQRLLTKSKLLLQFYASSQCATDAAASACLPRIDTCDKSVVPTGQALAGGSTAPTWVAGKYPPNFTQTNQSTDMLEADPVAAGTRALHIVLEHPSRQPCQVQAAQVDLVTFYGCRTAKDADIA